MNNLKSTVTNHSPFDLLYTNCSGASQIKDLLATSSAKVDDVEDIKLLAVKRLKEAQDSLRSAHEISKRYYDSKHSKIDPFKVGDWAMIRLSLRPIKMNQHKLTEPLIGPYQIKEAFERSVILDLPSHLKLHPRFSIQHIERCPAPDSDPFKRDL